MAWKFWRRNLEPETFGGVDLKVLRAKLEAYYGSPFPQIEVYDRDRLPRWARPP